MKLSPSIRMSMLLFCGLISLLFFVSYAIFSIGTNRTAIWVDKIYSNYIPIIEASHLASTAVQEGQRINYHLILQSEQLKDFDELRWYESQFRKTMINFDMYAKAVMLGSESEAFARSSGGLTQAMWVQKGLKGKLIVQPAPWRIQQLYGIMDTDYSEFVKTVLGHIQLLKKVFRLKTEQRVTALQGYHEKAKKMIKELDSLTMRIHDTIQKVDDELQRYSFESIRRRDAVYRMMVLLGIFWLMILLGGTVIFSNRVIIGPIRQLTDSVLTLGREELGREIEVGKGSEIRQLSDSFAQVSTELRRSKKIIEKNEDRLRTIINNALDAVITIDATGTITSWNHQAQIIFGWDAQETIGRKLASCIIPLRYREAHKRGLERFLSTGQGPVLNKRIEISALKRDGAEIDVELSITPVQVGNDLSFSAFVRDITERKRTETQIRQLSQAVEQSPTTVFITNPEGIIEYSNPKFTQLTGYNREEIVGTLAHILRPDKMSPEEYQHRWETIRSGREWRGEHLNKKKNSEAYWELTIISPIKDPQGKITNLLIIAEDITQRKLFTQRLQEEKNALEVFHQATVAQEMDAIALKREVNELLTKRGQPVKYTEIEEIERLTKKIEQERKRDG